MASRVSPYYYLLVTQDKYELPLAVCDTAAELGAMLGVAATTIRSAAYRAERGWYKHPRYRRVPKEGKDD